MIDDVGELIRQAARIAVLPLFRHLAEDDVEEKAPGDVVTVADREAEKIIAAGLLELMPDSAVVGEEAVAADRAVLRRVRGGGPVWLVDPIDGTANFAAGRGPFKMMVALLRDGVTEASWILDPRADSLSCARRGAGAFVDGDRVWVADRADRTKPATLRGSMVSRFLPRAAAPRCREAGRRFRRGAARPALRRAGVSGHRRRYAGLRVVLAYLALGPCAGRALRRGGRRRRAPARRHAVRPDARKPTRPARRRHRRDLARGARDPLPRRPHARAMMTTRLPSGSATRAIVSPHG